MSHQRKSLRKACVVPVEGREGGLFDQTQAVDFSRGGLGFVSKHRIPLNKEIPIEIELSVDGKPVFVVGRVKWVRKISHSSNYRIGLTFVDVMRGSKSRLQEYFVNKSNS